MKQKALSGLALVALLTAAGPVFAQGSGQGPIPEERLAELKQRALEGIEARSTFAQQMNDSIFSFAELAFQEFETSKYITDILEKNGFKVERGVAGLPTGWVARSGG